MPKQSAYQRHDISDQVWNKLALHLPGRKGAWGGVAKDNRRFLTPFSGCFELGLHGVIYLLTMDTGIIRTDVFVDGAIMEHGRSFWNYFQLNQTTRG